MKKIINLINRIKQYKKDYNEDLKEFGFKVAFVKYFCAVFFMHNSSLYINTLQKYINNMMAKYINSYIYIYIYTKYSVCDKKENIYESEKIPVWFCWFQGEDNMPQLNKICYNRLKQVVPTDRAEIKFITFDNIKDYVQMPDFILEKLKTGVITYTHFSDHLRYCLLANYGGLWIDSSIFLTTLDLREVFETPFWTAKCSKIIEKEPGKGQSFNGLWFVNSQASKKFFSVVYDLCVFYWFAHNRILDYVLADYVMNFIIAKLSWAMDMFKAVESGNDYYREFDRNMNIPYNPDFYDSLFNKNGFQKTSGKHKYEKTDKDGNLTIFGYLCDKYLD